MSHGQVIFLAKEILKAQKEIDYRYQDYCGYKLHEERNAYWRVVAARMHLAGLCVAMAKAAKAAALELQDEDSSGQLNRIAEAEKEHKP